MKPTTRPSDFARTVAEAFPYASTPERVDTLMLNVGLSCDLSCAHCHHACSPDRLEVMSRTTLHAALRLAEELRPALVDVTGGEPALYAHIRELVELAHNAGLPVRVRTNLIALARPESADLPALFARTGTHLLASVPGGATPSGPETDLAPHWQTPISVLRNLASYGYGYGSLSLELAHNPAIGELPESQEALESELRFALEPRGVRFTSVLSIANVPVGRLAQQLDERGETAAYRELLRCAFNPAVAAALECRHGLEVAWDGTLWDCDFNLAAGLPPATGPLTVWELLADPSALAERRIGFGPHCFACTAGAGSG